MIVPTSRPAIAPPPTVGPEPLTQPTGCHTIATSQLLSDERGVIMAQAAVDRLLDELAGAWNAGDARAYGALFSPDVTFTNTDGSVDLGRDEVVRHADEAFRGVLAGTKISLAVRKLRLIRPD